MGRGGAEARPLPPASCAPGPPSSLGAGSWALRSSLPPPAHPRSCEQGFTTLTPNVSSNRTYFLYPSLPFLATLSLPSHLSFSSLISSPSLLPLLPQPSSLLHILGDYFGHNRGFKLSPFFQFSKLKPYA